MAATLGRSSGGIDLRPILTSAAVLASLAAIPACKDPVDDVDGTVVVLVLDGVRLEESLGDDPSNATGEDPAEFMPTVWDELVSQGLRSTDTWSLAPTTTTPAHVAMVAGRRLPVANYPAVDSPGLYRPSLPLLPELLELSQSDALSSYVANTTLLWPLESSLWPGTEDLSGTEWVFVGEDGSTTQPTTNDLVVLQALQQRLSDRPTSFAMANLHQVDRDGHFGDDDDYLDTVRELDAPVADLWAWLQDQPRYQGDTWLLIIADHGRHSAADSEPPWRHHGCSCNGCRRLPFLLLGPGVQVGQQAGEPILLTDLGPTLGALLGVEMPWAEGLVRDDLFEAPTGVASRSGVADFAVAGGVVAEVVYRDDPAHRSELLVDGHRLSDPDAVAVEAPALVRTDDTLWLCFREVVLEPDGDESAWRPSCLISTDAGASWDSFVTPVDLVGPFWRPQLLVSELGELLAVYGYNPQGLAADGGDIAPVTLDLSRFDGEEWTTASAAGTQSFPTDVVAIRSGDVVHVALGASDGSNDARNRRGIYSGTSVINQAELSFGTVAVARFEQLAPDDGPWRVEHPALREGSDGSVELAAVGLYEGGSVAILASGPGGAGSWTQAAELPLQQRLNPGLSPAWLGDLAVFAAHDVEDDAAWLCAGSLGREPVCLDADADRVSRLAADGGVLYALTASGDGAWELHSWDAQDFAP